MVDFLIFCMATVGLTAILVDGKIFAPFREGLERRVLAQEERREASIARGGKGALRPATRRRTWSGFLLDILTCYQCCGFWSGLFCGVFLTFSRFVFAPPFYVLNGAKPMLEIIEVEKAEYLLFAPVIWLMCGLAGSFLALVWRMFVELIFEKTMLCRRSNPEAPQEVFSNEESPEGFSSEESSEESENAESPSVKGFF